MGFFLYVQYEHVYRKHGTGYRNQLCTKFSKVRACPSERHNANKQAELARASMSSSISSSPCSQSQPRDRNRSGLYRNTTTYKQPCDARGSHLSNLNTWQIKQHSSSPCILFRSCIRPTRYVQEHKARAMCKSSVCAWYRGPHTVLYHYSSVWRSVVGGGSSLISSLWFMKREGWRHKHQYISFPVQKASTKVAARRPTYTGRIWPVGHDKSVAISPGNCHRLILLKSTVFL